MNQVGRLVTELLEGRMEAAGLLYDLLVNEQCPPGKEHRAVVFQIALSHLASSLFTTYNRFEKVADSPPDFEIHQAYYRIRAARDRFNLAIRGLFFFDINSPTEILPVLTSQLACTGLPPEPTEPLQPYPSGVDPALETQLGVDSSVSPFSSAE